MLQSRRALRPFVRTGSLGLSGSAHDDPVATTAPGQQPTAEPVRWQGRGPRRYRRVCNLQSVYPAGTIRRQDRGIRPNVGYAAASRSPLLGVVDQRVHDP